MSSVNFQGEYAGSYFLKPGELYYTSGDREVKTVLGSCIMVTMFSPEIGLAAACHALLPSCSNSSCSSNLCPSIGKYVTCVLPEMVRLFKEKGIKPDYIETKIFGGADMIIFRKDSWNVFNPRIGRKNIVTARSVLRDNQLKVISSDVGGTLGRKISFDTGTGNVRLQRLPRAQTSSGFLEMPNGCITEKSFVDDSCSDLIVSS